MQPPEPEPEPTISGCGSKADHVRRKHANAGSNPAAQTRKSNTKSKGNLAELAIATLLVKGGFIVSFPYGDNAPYDIIAESVTGKLNRIQVRYVSWKGDILQVRLSCVSRNKRKPLDFSRIDCVAIWDGNKAYFVPSDLVRNHVSTFTLRARPCQYNRLADVNFAVDFEKLECLS